MKERDIKRTLKRRGPTLIYLPGRYPMVFCMSVTRIKGSETPTHCVAVGPPMDVVWLQGGPR